MSSPRRVSDLVHRFLGSIGRPKEAEFYLSLFRGQASGSFAVLAVSDSVVREGAGALVADLTFLTQLGLLPVVVLGVGGGNEAGELAAGLAERLAHIPARVAPPDRVSEITSRGELALVALSDGELDSRFDALGRLVEDLGSRKLVFVGRRSGLQLPSGEVESLVSIAADYQRLMAPGLLVDSQRVLLREVKRLMDTIVQPLTTSVTSPLDLLRELFTVKGAGTLIRRGSQVQGYSSYDEVDVDRLRALIERAWGKPAAPDLFDRPILALYLERDYRSAALVSPAPIGAYLSKFAVDVAARGEGLGRDLWAALTSNHPRLLWRSRPDNPIESWYRQVCDGMSKDRDWHVFWRGLPTAELPAAVEFALSAPRDFE